MINKIKLLIATAMLSLLTACGGGGDGGGATQRLYGSIALKLPITIIGASVITKQSNQADADKLALNQCGSGCVISYQFLPNDQCGAVVYGTGRVLTWGVGSTQSEAINSATLKCVNGGGTFCTVQTYSCHNG